MERLHRIDNAICDLSNKEENLIGAIDKLVDELDADEVKNLVE